MKRALCFTAPMVLLSAMLVGVLGAYFGQKEVPGKEVPTGVGTKSTAPVGAPMHSAAPGPSLEREAEAAPPGCVEAKRLTPRDTAEHRNQPTLADPPCRDHWAAKPGRHVIYVRVEAEQVVSMPDEPAHR